MSLAYIRKTYNVPARIGGRVRYGEKGQLGTITGVAGAHLMIKLDDAEHPSHFHPTWRLEYLDGGDIADDVRAAELRYGGG